MRNLGFYDILFAGAPKDFRDRRKAVGSFCTRRAWRAERVKVMLRAKLMLPEETLPIFGGERTSFRD